MKIMKKRTIASFLLLLVLAFLTTVPLSLAQEQTNSGTSKMMMAPDYYPQPMPSTNFLGQNHNYSVTFRGNAEAVVSARIIFSNLEESTMSAMTLRVPRAMPQDVMVYQISREPQCIRYRTLQQPAMGATVMPIDPRMGSGIGIAESIIDSLKPVCEEYQEPDFTQYWYGGNTYHKAEVIMGTDSFTINFP